MQDYVTNSGTRNDYITEHLNLEAHLFLGGLWTEDYHLLPGTAFAKLSNMKTLIPLIIVVTLLAACGNNKKGGHANDSQSSVKKNVTKRDYSITRTNAYNDLFLDSSRMEEFVTAEKLPDTLAKRIRSFYNARNYQFAWFSSDGLTEQARGFWNLHSYYTKYSDDSSLNDKKLKSRMEDYIAADTLTPSANENDFINTER